MNLLIKNGTVVTTEAMTKADVLIKDGKIAAVATDINADNCETVDASGLLVLPGAIDSHTHLAMSFGNTMSSDDYFTGTRSAACGGTTTVFDFITQDKGELMQNSFFRRNAIAAPDAAVDYSFHIGVSDISTPLLIESIKNAVSCGISSFKAYMVYDFGLDDGSLFELLKASASAGAIVGVHAENRAVLNSRVKQFLSEGKKSAWWHYKSRDEAVEGEADERAIRLAMLAQAPLYIAHLADKQGMEAVTHTRDEGYPLFAETCPQYLNFTCEVYRRERGRDFVCSPPIKNQESQDAIWAGIKRGDITTIATDHCPFTRAEKDWGISLPDGREGNFTTIPNGCAGIENMYPYMLSKANNGHLPFTEVVRLCAQNPAKLFGIDHVKGAIRVGLDADIVLYDKNKNVTVTNSDMHGATDYTIWEGVKLNGYPVATYSRGRLVYKNDEFLGKRGDGKFVKCNPVSFSSPLL